MSAYPTIAETDVETLAQRLATDPEAVQLIDVREPQELEIASLPKFVNLPLSQFGEWSGRSPPNLTPPPKRLSCATWVCAQPRCASG